MIPILWYIAPIGAILALAFAAIFFQQVKKANPGNARMVEIATYVREGAFAYLKQQYKGVALFFLGAFLVFLFMSQVLHVLHWLVPFAFLTGGFFSALAGYVGMNMATLASNRTAQACSESLNKGLKIAFRGGAVMGLTVVGLALIDISAWFFILNKAGFELHTITVIMLSFGMGASTQALFARLGGGIFTKAADVGADLVGKVEAEIPEDDVRNPATIADNVGDNVGDVAGMGADLYESYAGSILATAALGMSAVTTLGSQFASMKINFVIAPMVLAGIGALLSIIGVFMVSTKEKAGPKELMFALNKSVYGSSILIAIASFFITRLLLPPDYYFGVFISTVIGLLCGILIGLFTEKDTSHSFEPTRNIASQGTYGPATVILEGIAVGMRSTAGPVITIVLGILIAFICSHGFQSIEMGLYGIGFGAVGMLATLGVTLAMDAFGPIADNAGGNAQMAHLPEDVREMTDNLDSVGNTTAATGKGFAIGSAALTAMALLAAYLEEVRAGLTLIGDKVGQYLFLKINYGKGMVDYVKVDHATVSDFINFFQIHVLNPKFLLGLFIGGMVVFVFAALTIKAVGKAAGKMVAEVRRQFHEIPGILEGTAKPEYSSCVKIATIGAQQQMLLPALIGIITPIVTGMVFGVAGVLGVLAGAMVSGFVLAIMLNNSGGAWDNAKKYVETGEHGGKSSSVHKATVVGDTVGDPFKDTAGPCINILIKLMSMVSIVFAGLIVNYSLRVETIQPPFTKQKIDLSAHNEIISVDKAKYDRSACAGCEEISPDCFVAEINTPAETVEQAKAANPANPDDKTSLPRDKKAIQP
jgi:K(+)-stimulated pyrophosphate-energized sodium pump